MKFQKKKIFQLSVQITVYNLQVKRRNFSLVGDNVQYEIAILANYVHSLKSVRGFQLFTVKIDFCFKKTVKELNANKLLTTSNCTFSLSMRLRRFLERIRLIEVGFSDE